ncbi:MAG TPA: hypothetical protein VKF41_00745 [Bryobacteraceae bacterium]|nr:hypothetical protein [Bryobacteraceae bacterium]
MKKSIIRKAQADEAVLTLGKVLGQSMAFGTIAGRCSAAQAAALQQARTEKAYRSFGLTWKEFCPKHLRMSGTQADEIIRLLREFGPEYFENTESVRISPDTYRLVAPYIQEKTLRVEGETLELNSANVQKVAKCVRESQRALPPPAEPEPAPAPAATPALEAAVPAACPSLSDRIDALYRHSMGIAAEFREVAKDCRQADQSPIFHSMLRSTITLACCEMRRVSLENGVV